MNKYLDICVCMCEIFSMSDGACMCKIFSLSTGKGEKKISPSKVETIVSNVRVKLYLVNISWKFQLMRSA